MTLDDIKVEVESGLKIKSTHIHGIIAGIQSGSSVDSQLTGSHNYTMGNNHKIIGSGSVSGGGYNLIKGDNSTSFGYQNVNGVKSYYFESYAMTYNLLTIPGDCHSDFNVGNTIYITQYVDMNTLETINCMLYGSVLSSTYNGGSQFTEIILSDDIFGIDAGGIYLSNISTTANDTSITMGIFNNSYGISAISIGEGCISKGQNSVSIGYFSNASSLGVAIGAYSTAIAAYSTIIGGYSTTNGAYSNILGFGNITSGSYSTAIGYGATANGYASIAIGQGVLSKGDYSTAEGYRSVSYNRFEKSYSTNEDWGIGKSQYSQILVQKELAGLGTYQKMMNPLTNYGGLVLEHSSSYHLDIQINSLATASGNAFSCKMEALITTYPHHGFIDIPTISNEISSAGASTWMVSGALSTSGSKSCFNLYCVSNPSEIVRWNAYIEYTKVSF